jgi:hypothetical protein
MNDARILDQSRRDFLGQASASLGAMLVLGSSGQPQAPGGGQSQCSSGGSRPVGARFEPPAQLDDLTDSQRQAWSDGISALIDNEIQTSETPVSQFFNPLTNPPSADQQTKTICWTAFPNLVLVSSPSDKARWKRADSSRDLQDEYCEWSVTRNPAGKITRVTFTCEGPEYWEFLAANDQKKTLALYQQYVNPAVTLSDLYPDGVKYNPRNRWNSTTTDGAMHLVQRNNTLSAEIDIVARATVRRLKNPTDDPNNPTSPLKTGEQELIACSGYGEAHRNSDPHIGGEVNALSRLLADITVANPVGLYLDGFYPTSVWKTPDNSDPKDFWSIVRGQPDMAVRAVYEVPASKGFVVGDIKINNIAIDFASQITDYVKIKVTGLACRIGKSSSKPLPNCPALQQSFSPQTVPMHKLVGQTPQFLDRRR